MISNKDVVSALNNCEALCSSLQDRYNVAKLPKESNIAKEKETGSARKVTPPVKPVEVVKSEDKSAQPSVNGLSTLGNKHQRSMTGESLFSPQMDYHKESSILGYQEMSIITGS